MIDGAAIGKLHIPVLKAEVLTALSPKAGGRYLDGTLGLGGHAEAVLKIAPESLICGLDRDANSLELARLRLAEFGSRVSCFHLPFADFAEALKALDWPCVDGAMLDLGVSSPQLDEAERGFSFNADGPIDMRMDQSGCEKSAWHLVNRAHFEKLREIIATLGEEPQAGRIARNIVEARQKGSIDTTLELADIICKSYPPAWRRKARRHPATRTFQALRMSVNDELGQLALFLDSILGWLRPGGRLVVISFHSLEDRMVKQAMKKWAAGCHPDSARFCSRNENPPLVRMLYKKPVCAGVEEVHANPRAGSAKLRACEKLEQVSNGAA